MPQYRNPLGSGQGIGDGWDKLGAGLFGGATPGVYEEALYKGYLGQKAKHDAAKSLEEAAMAANERTAREGGAAMAKNLGFQGPMADAVAQLAAFGGDAQALANAYYKMNTMKDRRGFSEAGLESGMAPLDAYALRFGGDTAPVMSAYADGTLYSPRSGPGDNDAVLGPLGSAREKLIGAQIEKEQAHTGVYQEQKASGGYAPSRAGKGKEGEAAKSYARNQVRANKWTLQEGAAWLKSQGFRTEADDLWIPGDEKETDVYGPVPSDAPKAAAPADEKPPVPGARRGKDPQGRPGWYVKGKDGKNYEVFP